MTAIAIERDTQRRDGGLAAYGVLTGVKVLAGTIVALTATGFAQGGATATTLKAAGVANETADNTGGASGDIKVTVRRDGWFRFANSASGDLITIADIGNSCYIVDNQTVAKTDGGTTRSVAGKIRDVDAQGVWIEFI
jgi:outer membrane lipoprotein-sorting protein